MSAVTRLSALVEAASADYYSQVDRTHRMMIERSSNVRTKRLAALPTPTAIRDALERESLLLARKSALEEAFRAVCEEGDDR